MHAATRSAAEAAGPFVKGPRAGQPVQARHLSLYPRPPHPDSHHAGRHRHRLPARAGAHHAALQTIATAKVTTDRHRHRDHKIKTRQAFTYAPRGITTRTASAVVHVCGTTLAGRAA